MPLNQILDAALIRFGIVAALGLTVDFCVSWTLAEAAGLPLPIAALGGFLVAASGNYVAHEKWTFGKGGGLSARRGAVYLMLMTATLGVRLGVVSMLQAWVFARGQKLLPLVLATGSSFLFNFCVSRWIVFRRPSIEAEFARP